MDWFELSENGKTEEMKKLLENNQVDVNIQNDNEWTALMIAAINSNTSSNIETVKLLLDNGANVNLKEGRGWTALMLAVRYSNTASNIETVKLLLDNGANVNLKNNSHWTALLLSLKYMNTDSSIETVKLLLEYGADVNSKNNSDWSALMLAAKYSSNNIETVKLLLEYGADPFAKNQQNKSALEYCVLKKCEDVINKEIWKKIYNTDKMFANKLNKKIPIGKDAWEIIMLNKRQQTLCQNLSTNKNIGVLIEFALEFGIPIEKIRKMTKGQLCGTISRYLAYGKNASMEKIEKEKSEIIKFAREYAKKFGIDMNLSNDKILKELSKIL